jgi:hypothetical protein
MTLRDSRGGLLWQSCQTKMQRADKTPRSWMLKEAVHALLTALTSGNITSADKWTEWLTNCNSICGIHLELLLSEPTQRRYSVTSVIPASKRSERLAGRSPSFRGDVMNAWSCISATVRQLYRSSKKLQGTRALNQTKTRSGVIRRKPGLPTSCYS